MGACDRMIAECSVGGLVNACLDLTLICELTKCLDFRVILILDVLKHSSPSLPAPSIFTLLLEHFWIDKQTGRSLLLV